MKKLFFGMAAAVLSAAMCLQFAACGGSGADKAKSIKSAEVTEEQWNAAFEALEKDDAKFTVEFASAQSNAVETEAADGGKKSGTFLSSSAVTYVINGAKQWMKGEQTLSVKGDYSFAELAAALEMPAESYKEGTTKSEQYAEKTGAGYSLYSQAEDGSWSKSLPSPFYDLNPIENYERYGDFAEFKYDETLKGYVEKDYTESSKSYFVYKFDGSGMLVAICMHYGDEYTAGGLKIVGSSDVNMLISYKADEIDLPAVG